MGEYYFDGISIVNKRKRNMDRLLLKKHNISGSDVFLGVVCDGVGSRHEGDYASDFAVKELNDFINKLESVENIGTMLHERIKKIDGDIVNNAKINKIQTASTLSSILLFEGRFYIVHAGDSRIYRYRNGVLGRMTYDMVSEEGKLTSYIGGLCAEEMFLSEGTYEDDEIFLLCSDGLNKRVYDTAIQDRLTEWDNRYRKNKKKNLTKLLNALKMEAVEAGEKDNITIALVITE